MVVEDAEERLNEVARVGAPAHELGVAAVLAGWLYDDFAAALARAPVPEDIVAADEHLRSYVDGLMAAMRPLLETALERFEQAVAALQGAGPGWWQPWLDHARARLATLRSLQTTIELQTVRVRLARSTPAEATAPVAPVLDLSALPEPASSGAPATESGLASASTS